MTLKLKKKKKSHTKKQNIGEPVIKKTEKF